IREYARIQTFPDKWQFAGSLSAQYRRFLLL
ncbi:MAG: DNA cytosine methyltransferase, partial [Paraglaciecola sp.]|nr:DNA cytosine methyltransferase [Paraglaciecola sp.]